MENFIPQEIYNLIISNIPIVCVDICIVKENKILLVKRKDAPAKGEYWIPGGRLFKGESLEECALRKAYEEVGLRCKIIKKMLVESTVFNDGPNEIPVHSVNIAFQLKPEEDKVCLDSHSDDYYWFTLNEEIPQYFHPYIVNCFKLVDLNLQNI